MKTYKGYLIDLDGTMYNGTEKVEEACEFVRTLKDRGVPSFRDKQLFTHTEAGGGQARVF